MNDRKTIPIAYVTKWATTRGIIIVRDAEVTEHGALYGRNCLYVPASQWTEDKEEAVDRWHASLLKAAASAEKKADALRAAASFTPKYTER